MEDKKALFEKFMNDVKRIWKIAPRGLILWNGCIITLLTVTVFVNIELFFLIQAIGSFLAFAIMLDNDLSGSSSPRNFWTIATVFAWIMFVFIIFVGMLQLAHKHTFGRMFEQDEIRRLKFEKEEREETKTKSKYQNILESKNKEKKKSKLLGN